MPARRPRLVLAIRRKKVIDRRKKQNPNGRRAYKFREVGPQEIGKTIQLVWIPEMVEGLRRLDAQAEKLRREVKAESLEMTAHHGDRIVHLSNIDYHHIPGIGYKVLDRINPKTKTLVQVYYNPFNRKTFDHSTRRTSEKDLRTPHNRREPTADH